MSGMRLTLPHPRMFDLASSELWHSYTVIPDAFSPISHLYYRSINNFIGISCFDAVG